MIDISAEVGEGHDLGIEVISDRPIAAERPMYFNYGPGWGGGHDVVGRTEPRTTFYFAEGTTREGFCEYLTLANPHPDEVEITLTYYAGGGGGILGTELLRIPPSSRKTVFVNQVVGEGRDVSVAVEASLPIAAERPMYFNCLGHITGGTCVSGYAI